MQTQTQVQPKEGSKFGPVQIGIVVTTLITAGIHFYLVQSLIAAGMSPVLFILNGLGYLGLMAALFVPLPIFQRYRALIRYIFIGYTLLTILLWVVMGMRTPIGYIDKLVEVLLVIFLWLDRGR